jgi:hypothetical protein
VLFAEKQMMRSDEKCKTSVQMFFNWCTGGRRSSGAVRQDDAEYGTKPSSDIRHSTSTIISR